MAAEVPAAKAVKRLSPVEALEEALRIIEGEPLGAVELAVQALKGLNHTFEVSSLESALRAHRARLQLESGGGVEASG